MYNIIVFFRAIERFGFIYLPMHKQYTVCILCGYRDYPKIRVHACFQLLSRPRTCAPGEYFYKKSKNPLSLPLLTGATAMADYAHPSAYVQDFAAMRIMQLFVRARSKCSLLTLCKPTTNKICVVSPTRCSRDSRQIRIGTLNLKISVSQSYNINRIFERIHHRPANGKTKQF